MNNNSIAKQKGQGEKEKKMGEAKSRVVGLVAYDLTMGQFSLSFFSICFHHRAPTTVARTLPLDDFKRFLYSKKYAIITLVNQRLLKCPQCLVSVFQILQTLLSEGIVGFWCLTTDHSWPLLF